MQVPYMDHCHCRIADMEKVMKTNLRGPKIPQVTKDEIDAMCNVMADGLPLGA